MSERSPVIEQSPGEDGKDDEDERYGTVRAVCVGVGVLIVQLGLKRLGLDWDGFFIRLLALVPGAFAGLLVAKAIEAVAEHVLTRAEPTREELEQRLREFKEPPPERDEWRWRL